MTISTNFNQAYRYLLILLLSFQFLTGCALFQNKAAPQPVVNQNQQRLAALQDWQIKGKLIFKSPQKKFSASLNWQQQQQHSDIRLTTFLGISILKLRTDNKGATLDYDGQTHHSTDAETLLQQVAGLSWPLNDLSIWIKGMVANDQQPPILDQYQRISQSTLVDNHGYSWKVSYPAYQQVLTPQGDSYQLPKTIRLNGRNITLIIKISDWIINQ